MSVGSPLISGLRLGKRAMLHAARALRLGAAVRESEWRRRRLLILGYHGVSLDDEHHWDSRLYVSEHLLRRRFEHLRRHGYNVLSLEDAVTRLYAGTLPAKSVALTFDDGSFDFFVKAYPLLEEFGYHATLYLTTYYCGFQRPVFNTMASYLLWHGRGQKLELGRGLEKINGTIPASGSARQDLHARLVASTWKAGLGAGEKDDLARTIAGQVGLDYEELLEKRVLHIMSPDDVRALDPELVSVQLHTHRHRTPDDRTLFIREIRDNRNAIGELLGDASGRRHFCYPGGHYANSFLGWLKSAEVSTATTCDPGIASRDSNSLLLPRLVDSMEIPMIAFESWLSGLARFLPQRRGHRNRIG